MSVTPTTTPLSFRISEAYAQVRAANRSQAVARVDTGAGVTLPDTVQSLVAGVVPGGVDFSAGAAAPKAAGSLPFYRNPVAKNEAAVAIALGRSLDVEG